MSLNKGKIAVKAIDGIRCAVIETGITESRMTFLKKILEHNGYVVKTEKEIKKDENLPDAFTIGVTDIVFNPIISVYERKLKTLDNKTLTPQYWKQIPDDKKTWLKEGFLQERKVKSSLQDLT